MFLDNISFVTFYILQNLCHISDISVAHTHKNWKEFTSLLDIPWKLKPSENLVTEKDNELAISGDVKITKTGDAAEKPKQAQQTSFSPSKRWHKTICPSG